MGKRLDLRAEGFRSNIKLHKPHQALDNPAIGWNPQSIHYMSSIQDTPPKTMYNGKNNYKVSMQLKSFVLSEGNKMLLSSLNTYIYCVYFIMSPVQCNCIEQYSPVAAQLSVKWNWTSQSNESLTVTLKLPIDHSTVVCSVAWPLNGSEAGGDLVLI